MQKPYLKTILCIIAFVVLVGMACNIGGSDPTATSAPVIQQAEPTPTATATTPPLPTATTAPPPTATTAPPTEEVYDEPPAYYVEEFEGGLDSWSYFFMSGIDTGNELYSENGYLVFDLQDEYQWVYVLYDEYTYSNVRIDVLAENRGKNTNNVSLICNYTDRFGWYEFNITNGGMYYIYAYSETEGDYMLLGSGGSTNINMGRDTNIYTAVCDGNQLALYINGYLETDLVDNKYNLSEGQVGMSVSSFEVLPILVMVDYFSISYP
jgi:hypothetical protein